MVIVLKVKLSYMLALPYYEEKWMKPEGFSIYLISNAGLCQNIHHLGKYLKHGVNKDGYLFYHLLGDDGKCHTCYVHRLVGKAFVPNPDPEHNTELNHKNQIKTDNRKENLEWCDRKYQMNYADIKERISETMTNHPLHSKPVEQYTLDMVFIKEYPSVMEAERQTGISHTKIVLVCQGKRKKAGGYIWRYA